MRWLNAISSASRHRSGSWLEVVTSFWSEHAGNHRYGYAGVLRGQYRCQDLGCRPEHTLGIAESRTVEITGAG